MYILLGVGGLDTGFDSMVVVKMRRKVCRGLQGIGIVGPMWLVNEQIVTGLRLVDHSRDSMLQIFFITMCVLHATVNVVIMYIAIALVFVGICYVFIYGLCVSVSCGQRVCLAT